MEFKKKILSHPLISKSILNGSDFNADEYTYVNEVSNAYEEHLIFIVHGIGQNVEKLKNTVRKIKSTINTLYEKKASILNKQIHVRIIDWKTLMLEKESDLLNNLLDRNNSTKYPKLFIQHVPLDLLQYLSSRNKYNIINDVVNQMNIYYNCVKKYRPLFKGNVSVAGHSLGSSLRYYMIF